MHCLMNPHYTVTRRFPLKLFALILLLATSLAACGGGSGARSESATPDTEAPEPARKPNILLIVADDLGYNDLAINNDNPEIDTKNMDQIARDGVRFTRHYAAAVCSPARAALLTGLYPERLGYLPNGRGISPEVVTLPERLQEAGYNTWHIGKWHIGDLERTAWPDHQGFDHWFGFLNQWRLAGAHNEHGELVLAEPRYNDPWLDSDSEPGRNYPGHLENILTDKAIEVLTELNNTQAPWFLDLWYHAPHYPIQPASEFSKRYPDTPAGKYRALVNQLDHNIGRVVSHLAAIDALQDTVVIIVSDNGGTNRAIDSNAPFRGVKTTLTEGGLRTPLIIQWPDKALDGQVVSQTVSIMDIYPTLMESIGITPPDSLDGDSFYRSIQHAEPPIEKNLMWEMGRDNYGILSADGRWRLHDLPPVWGVELEPKLYDLEQDPTGTQFVLPLPPMRVQQLTDEYQAWYKDVHTVRTTYSPREHGGGVLTGMDFLRTPGFGTYTFGIGVEDAQEGAIASQAGVWGLRRTGNTIAAQFGDLALTGNIQNSRSCHSVVITGNFSHQLQSTQGSGSMALTLYIDGTAIQSNQLEAILQVDDPTVATIIGDPEGAPGAGAVLPPVVMNTALHSNSPLTVEAFSQELCGVQLP